jgi:hypothetical protein
MPQPSKDDPFESPALPIIQPRKRKLDEVADSEDDEDEAFAWIESDGAGLSDEEGSSDGVPLVKNIRGTEHSLEASNDEQIA